MKVNDLVKTCGYTKDVLSHFIIILYDKDNEVFIPIQNPTSDEYIKLCDRSVLDWCVTDERDNSIEIYVKMKKTDYETFKSHKS